MNITVATPNLISRAKALALFTIAYNLVEGVVSVYFGIEENSISLAGFGVDSFIEVFSAIILYWKISGHAADKNKERNALRGISALFMILAATTLASAAFQLYTGRHPNTTLPGVIVSAVSLSFMFWLWKAKERVGQALRDPVILGDAACSRACIQLSVILFFGSLIYWVLPALWWVDSVAAIGISWFVFKEGREILNQDECCGCD